ncbi:MAG: cation:proton antiporter [Nanoarchaeota archaeon]|nr:cation:proton antiporter [Nanoarchaeota archaeon]
MVSSLLPFFIILSVGVLSSEIFRRFNLPYVLGLIFAGIIIGPVFNLLEVDSTIFLIGSIGLIFLMFMTGTEIKTENIKKFGKSIAIISILGGIIPFIAGFAIGRFFDYSILTSIFLGTCFISSSVAVVIPTLKKRKIMKTKIGQTIISATIFNDIASLLILALLLQSFATKTIIPLPIYLPSLILILIGIKFIVTKIEKKYYSNKKGKDLFESELRFIFAVLIATVLLFEVIGMHAIIAGFVIGIILSDSIRAKTEEKIHTISYGFFIPTFFIIVGMETDIFVFAHINNILLALAIIISLITTKLASGYIGGRLTNFSKKDSLLIGATSIPQLSTTLAAAYAGLTFGIIDQEIVSSLIMLSIVTIIISPFLINRILNK